MSQKSEQIKLLLGTVLYNSFAQAIIKIFQTSHWPLKLFLFTFVCLSSCLAAFMVISSTLTYLSFNVISMVRHVNEMPSQFPSVVICNMNMFQSEFAALQFMPKLKANYLSKLNKSSEFSLKKLSLAAINAANSQTLTDEMRRMLSNDLKDTLYDCEFNLKPCTHLDFVFDSFDSIHGACHRFNSFNNGSEHQLSSFLSGPLYGLKLKLFVNVHENLSYLHTSGGNILTDYNANGVVVRINNVSYMEDQFSKFQNKVSAGFHTDIIVTRHFSSRLSRPYSLCETNSDSFLYAKITDSNYLYSQQFCFRQCAQHYMITKCNCSIPLMLSLFPSDDGICTVDNECFKEKMDDISMSKNFGKEYCLSLCPLECENRRFDTKMVMVKMIGGEYYESLIKGNGVLLKNFLGTSLDKQKALESFVSFSIFYESLAYTQINEMPQMDLIGLMANIGGNLGLFLGVSLFSLCEIVEVLIEIIYIRNETHKVQIKNNTKI